MRKWMYLVLVVIWGVIATAVLSGGEGVSISRVITVATTVTDTCVDTLYGTVSDGDSGGYGLRIDGIDWTTYLPSYSADAESIWFDTAAWSCVGVFSDNDSNLINSCNPVILPNESLSVNKGWDVATAVVDSGSHDYTITLASATNDSEFVISDSLNYNSKGLTVTFTFRHSTIRADIDSFTTSDNDTAYGGRSEDSLWLHTKLTHTIVGWSFHGAERGGEITTYVDTGAWFFVPKANSYDIHFRCIKFTQKDSTIAKSKLQSKRIMDDIDVQPVDICSSAVCTDTTLAPENFYRYRFLDADGGPDTTWANGGFLGVAFRYITTVVDSESRPAYYGRGDVVRFLNVIEARY